MELGDSEGEEEASIKWRNYEIETLIAVRGEMEEEFAKSARKQGMNWCIKNNDIFFTNAKNHIKIGPSGPFKRLCPLPLALGPLPSIKD